MLNGGGRFRSGGPGSNSGFKLYDIDGRGDATLTETNARILMEVSLEQLSVDHKLTEISIGRFTTKNGRTQRFVLRGN
jgi:hypothetical protein